MHDYKRHGTTTLESHVSVRNGSVIGSCKERPRHQELLAFLKRVDRKTQDLDLYLVLDDYAATSIRRLKRGS
jgi:hypothetical protein